MNRIIIILIKVPIKENHQMHFVVDKEDTKTKNLTCEHIKCGKIRKIKKKNKTLVTLL